MQIGVMGQLEATANRHRTMGELLDTAPPTTPLGEQQKACLRTALTARSAA
jgi:hypothetical protein